MTAELSDRARLFLDERREISQVMDQAHLERLDRKYPNFPPPNTGLAILGLESSVATAITKSPVITIGTTLVVGAALGIAALTALAPGERTSNDYSSSLRQRVQGAAVSTPSTAKKALTSDEPKAAEAAGVETRLETVVLSNALDEVTVTSTSSERATGKNRRLSVPGTVKEVAEIARWRREEKRFKRLQNDWHNGHAKKVLRDAERYKWRDFESLVLPIKAAALCKTGEKERGRTLAISVSKKFPAARPLLLAECQFK